MNLEAVSQKHLSELELQVAQLLAVMRKAKLHNEPLAESLKTLERELGEIRRLRFDAANPKYRDY
jgi:hypothetical protein